MNEQVRWLAFASSVLAFAAYEGWSLWLARRHPERVARSAHARMRVAWVGAVSRQAGFEIVAVQALRNSLMSATIAASTAALALMATVGLASGTITTSVASGTLSVRAVLDVLLLAALFASYVCSAMAMRYFSHAGFVMSMPVAAPERESLNPMAATYVERAGLLYSWGLRSFLMVAPLVAGIVSPLAMPPMTLALIGVMWWFDRPARVALAGAGAVGP
jgi:hypothetical protein